jgi:hypothetical protein
MVALADIKKTLPNMPDDVIDVWLLPLANQEGMGWPPPNPMGQHRWNYILGEKPLEWWSEVSWQLQKTDCSFSKLSNGSRRTVQQMLAAHVDGVTNLYGKLDGEKERFKPALRHIIKHGSFPRPIVTVATPSGLTVVDGNHRMAAFVASQSAEDELLKRVGANRPSAEQEIWVGTHADGAEGV